MNESLKKIFELSLGKKLGIAGGILGLVGLMYYLYFLSPVEEEITKLDNSINGPRGLNSQISEKEGIARNLDTFKKEVERLDVELNKALKELPDKKETSGLLSRVSDKARDAGLDIKLFRPQGEEKKDFYAEVPVELEVQGTFHQVTTFFDEVGRMARIVNLGNIRLSQPEIGESNVNVNTTVVATAFRFLSEEERVVPKKGKKKRKKRSKSR